MCDVCGDPKCDFGELSEDGVETASDIDPTDGPRAVEPDEDELVF